jgi:hypothetical protein
MGGAVAPVSLASRNQDTARDGPAPRWYATCRVCIRHGETSHSSKPLLQFGGRVRSSRNARSDVEDRAHAPRLSSHGPSSATVWGLARIPLPQSQARSTRLTLVIYRKNEIRGLEQNPDTKSRWAQMARSGKKVMQFIGEGRYLAVVVDGKVTLYAR